MSGKYPSQRVGRFGALLEKSKGGLCSVLVRPSHSQVLVIRSGGMPDDDRSAGGDVPSEADRTLMGVAPPSVESSPESVVRSPVFVRSGTAAANADLPPISQFWLPKPESDSTSRAQTTAPSSYEADGRNRAARRSGALPFLRIKPIFLVLASAAFAAALTATWFWKSHGPDSRPVRGTMSAVRALSPAGALLPDSDPLLAPTAAAALRAKAPDSLSSRELLLLAKAESERKVHAANALHRRVEANPLLGQDPAIRSELLQLSFDALTAPRALAAMALLAGPIGPDLLYEVWTRSSEQSDVSELARALVYSSDVRPKASPALGVALELRAAATCEEYRALLPKLRADGDLRTVPVLSKLNVKHGCGERSRSSCYGCLRGDGSGGLSAALKAVKGRPRPSWLQ